MRTELLIRLLTYYFHDEKIVNIKIDDTDLYDIFRVTIMYQRASYGIRYDEYLVNNKIGTWDIISMSERDK